MADKKSGDQLLDRRGFLKALGVGAGAATAAAAAVTIGPDAALAGESEAEKRKARYKETDHVKAYYRTNRY